MDSTAELAPNQFSLRDGLHAEVSADSICRRDSNRTVEEIGQETLDSHAGLDIGQAVDGDLRNNTSPEEGFDDAKLRLISESMLQYDENSSKNGSEVRS